MKVLLSAYACEPDKGSEPGVGWHWAIEIARLGHEVHVITRANNADAIAAAIAAGHVPANLFFHYCDLSPGWIRVTKRWLRSPYLYYYFWQRRAADLAKRLHAEHRFDMVHHITFASARLPSFMGELGIPLVLGPVGGGETTPWRLRHGYSLRGNLLEVLRDLSNAVARFDPLLRRTYHDAREIWLRSPDNRALVPKRDHAKVRYLVGIGVSKDQIVPRPDIEGTPSRVLFVGRLVHWKGAHLALQAFARSAANKPDLTLTVLGTGPESGRLRRLARRLGLDGRVTWVRSVPPPQMTEMYRQHDVLLFPSLHDSAGMVVLEASAAGLPVISLDLGGPASLVPGEMQVSARSRSQKEVVSALADKLDAVVRVERSHWSRDSLLRVREMRWERCVSELYAGKSGEAD